MADVVPLTLTCHGSPNCPSKLSQITIPNKCGNNCAVHNSQFESPNRRCLTPYLDPDVRILPSGRRLHTTRRWISSNFISRFFVLGTLFFSSGVNVMAHSLIQGIVLIIPRDEGFSQSISLTIFYENVRISIDVVSIVNIFGPYSLRRSLSYHGFLEIGVRSQEDSEF